MARKIDLTGVKSFFLEKGEKVGLLACVGAAAVLIGYGVMHGMSAKTVGSSSDTYPSAIERAGRDARAKQERGEELPSATTIAVVPWNEQPPNEFPWTRLQEQSDRANNKRTNPRALAPLADPEGKYVDMKYVSGTYYALDVNQQQKIANVPGAGEEPKGPAIPKFFPFNKQPQQAKTTTIQQPFVTVQPMRMVVVHTVFPLQSQLDEFRKAFRMMNLHDLFQSGDLPKFVGMNIMKAEVAAGKPAVWTPLIVDRGGDKLEVDPAILAMFRQALLDDTPSPVNYAMIQGLTMPLPKRAGIPPSDAYPAVDLQAIPPLEDMGDMVDMKINRPPMFVPGMAGPAAGAAGAAPIDAPKSVSVPWSKLPQELRDKLTDGYYVLDPTGIHPNDDAQAVVPNTPAAATSIYRGVSEFSPTRFWGRYPQPPAPPVAAEGSAPGAPPVPQPQPMANAMKPYDALIRFVDPDVKPGKTYKYSIQVRIANPNFGKKTEVAYAALADWKELPPAPPVETPTITIPEEYFIYAIDQRPDNPGVKGGSDERDAKADQVAVQIHRWVATTRDAEGVEIPVGDWAIAERLLLQRGDSVGRIVNIEMPVFNKHLPDYVIPRRETGPIVPKKIGFPFGKKADAEAKEDPNSGAVGIPIDFTETVPPAVLVDFDGGKKSAQFPGETRSVKDESASNLLILRPDGRLIVRNTRVDSDPDSQENAVRQNRVEEWKAKVRRFRVAPNPGASAPAPANNPFLR